MRRNLLHPRMLQNLRDFYPDIIVVEEAAITQDDYGAEQSTHNDLEHTRGARARISPAGSGEIRGADGTFVERTHTAVLNGYYPQIKEKHRLVANGGNDVYDVTLVEHDGEPTYTRLQLRMVT